MSVLFPAHEEEEERGSRREKSRTHPGDQALVEPKDTSSRPDRSRRVGHLLAPVGSHLRLEDLERLAERGDLHDVHDGPDGEVAVVDALLAGFAGGGSHGCWKEEGGRGGGGRRGEERKGEGREGKTRDYNREREREATRMREEGRE